MPELPEVETVRATLEPVIKGKRIAGVSVRSSHCLVTYGREGDAQGFCEGVCGRVIRGLARRGKYLLFGLDDSLLVVHLRMTGALVYSQDPAAVPSRHTHVILRLEDGGEVRFQDQRRFGRLWLERDGSVPQGLTKLGPDPFEIDEAGFLLRVRASRRPVKAVLLDQEVVSGVGNIYADEALYAAGIHPSRPAFSLADEEASRLYRAVREILRLAIAHGGTTFSDYRDGLGRPGGNAANLTVYRQEGGRCRRCGGIIVRLRVGGRTARCCPGCQT